MRRSLCNVALATIIALSCPDFATAQDRFSVEMLLRQEGLGAVRISPDGTWVAVERQAPYDTAPAYRFAQYTSRLLTKIDIFDATQGVKTITLGSDDRRTGYLVGPFSPDGRRMVVYRLTLDRLTAGVVTLSTGAVIWLPCTPEETQFGRTIAWRGNNGLLLITRPDDSLPLLFRVGHQAQDRVADLWARTASGQTAGSVYLPSGVLRDTRAQAGPLELVDVDLDTGHERRLLQGALYDLVLAPDGRTAAVLGEDQDLQPDPQTPLRVGDPMRRRTLHLVNLDDGVAFTPDQTLDFAPYLAAWSPDSKQLLGFARPAGSGDFETMGAYTVIGRDGHVSVLSPDRFAPALERSFWGEPIGLGGWANEVPLLRIQDPSLGARWRSADGQIDAPALPGDRLALWDGALHLRRGERLDPLSGGEPILGAVTQSGDRRDMGNRADWSPDRFSVAGLFKDGCLVADVASEPICVSALASDERMIAASASGGVVVTRQDRSDGAAAIRLHRREGAHTLVAVNAARAHLTWGDVIEVPHRGPQGEPLKSWVLLPPNLRPGQSVPLVADVYVGRTDEKPPALFGRGSSRLQNNPAVLAAAGYAVLYISLPNPPNGRYDGATLARLILEIIDSAPLGDRVDTARVALLGHSYGAYNVLLAAPHSPRFAAVIASNGFADLTTAFNLPLLYRTSPDEGVPIGTLSGWAETGQGAIGVFPAQADQFVALSPLYQSQSLVAPTLLIESDLDRPRYGAMFGALYRLNREAALLTYFGEGHTVASPANVRDLHAHILDWLGRYLGPPARDPTLPMAGPRLQDGGQERLIAPLAPEQSVAIEISTNVIGVDDAVLD